MTSWEDAAREYRVVVVTETDRLRAEVGDLRNQLDAARAEIFDLRRQITGHCERIAAQSELLSKRAERPAN